jgi:hypothetical protein
MSVKGTSIWNERGELVDDQGVIPSFGPVRFDEEGRRIPESEELTRARRDAALRALRALLKDTSEDPPGAYEEAMKAILGEDPDSQVDPAS